MEETDKEIFLKEILRIKENIITKDFMFLYIV